MIKTTTIVPKEGELNSYINKPVLEKLNDDNWEFPKQIGVITSAIEVEDGYELTITLWGEQLKEELMNNEVSTFSIS
jgi:hypothetical protein